MKGFDRVILYLFYAYVFMLPFENMLEVVWGIDTPFRPYRILALLIGLLILLSRPWNRLFLYSNDLKLLGVYAFGLIPTTLAWGDGRLMYESFWLTSLQYFIVLWILLLIKNLPFQRRQLFICMNIYGTGVVINCLIMIEAFLFENVGRQSGWMDNSNFAAFANNVAFTYFFFLWYHQREYSRPSIRILLWLACLITFSGLVITGSRGALISLLVSVVLIVAYQFQLKRMIAKLIVLALPLFFVLQAYDLERMVNLLPAWNRVVTLAGKEEARTTLWGQGAEAFRDSYFIGLGIEQFKNPDNYRKYVHKTQNVSVASQHGLVLHNDYLTVLFEYGIPAFICFISFYYGIYWRLRIGKKLDPSWHVFIVCFWNMAIFSMFASSFQSHSMWLVYIILAFAAYFYSKPPAFAISPKTSTTS